MRISALVLAILLSACGNYHSSNGGSDNVNRAQGFSTLSYNALKATVFKPMCYQCHSNAGGNKAHINLESLANVQKILNSVVVAVQTNDMPMGRAPVPDQLKAALVLWAKAGAPETSKIPFPQDGSSLPPPAPPGFDMVSQKIFEPYCVRCHGFLTDYKQVVKNIDKIQGAIEADQMPKGGKPLNPKLKQMLSDWITAKLPLGFEDVKEKVFVPYCVRCHGSFVKYNSVAASIDEIQEMLKDNKMPKDSGPLPDKLKQLLNQWVDQNLPN